MVNNMTDYYMGLLIGAGIGYCVALITMVMMWALCVVSKNSEEGRDYAGKDSEDKYKQAKSAGDAD